GPYSLCRNPLYVFSMLAGIGIGFVSGSVTLLAATVVLLAVLHLRAAHDEERALLERHGEAFRRYCEQVPRFLPRRGRAEVPPSANVNFSAFRKSFFDAGSLFFLVASIGSVDVLRQ